MRETRPSGSEGGVARKRHPYPYLRSNPAEGGLSKTLRACFSSHPHSSTPVCRPATCLHLDIADSFR